MIKAFYRLNEAAEMDNNPDQIAQAIISRLKSLNGATPKWINGQITSLTDSPSKVRVSLQNLEDGVIRDEATKRNIENAKRVYDVLDQYGLLDKKSESQYDIVDRNLLSKVKQHIFTNPHIKGDAEEFKKQAKFQNEQATKDFVQRLEDAGLGESYRLLLQMNGKDLYSLRHLMTIQKKAREKKRNYSSYLLHELLDGGTLTTRMHELGFINKDGTLNNDMINNFVKMLKFDDNFSYKVKSFAKDLDDMLSKISSDAAYRDNAAAKRLAGSSVDGKAGEIVGLFSDVEKKLYLSNKITKRFRELGLVSPANKYTDLGKAVRILLKNQQDSLGDVVNTISGATGRDPSLKLGPLDPSQPDQTAQNVRRAAEVRDKKLKGGNFTDFSKFGK